mgnify:FL=1
MKIDIDISKVRNKEVWLELAKEVANHPDNFALWEKLINLTAFLPSINLKTKIEINHLAQPSVKQLLLLCYENLLVYFPYLEQYWVNYARWFYRFNELEKSLQTFQRALSILPGSILLWNTYLDLLLKINSDNTEMLNHFEEARMAIGYNYYSFFFYDKYLLFLQQNDMISETHLLLRRILEVPQHEYAKYFKAYMGLIDSADLKTIKYIITKEDLQNDFGMSWSDLFKQENLTSVKTEVRKRIADLYITTQYYAWKFYQYEKNLSTQYYVPNEPLTRLELQTWRSYLEFVENLNLKLVAKEKEVALKKNNSNVIDTLYRRCLIVTGSYHFFWIKYSNYYLNLNDIEKAKDILLQGIYMNPISNLKPRLRLVELYILNLEFDKAKALVMEGLELLPHNLQLFLKLLEVEHFTMPSNVEKMVTAKLAEISKIKNKELENQFDYLFVEMLNYSCITIHKLKKIFDKYKNKDSFYFTKAKKQFEQFYSGTSGVASSKILPDGFSCEYF